MNNTTVEVRAFDELPIGFRFKLAPFVCGASDTEVFTKTYEGYDMPNAIGEEAEAIFGKRTPVVVLGE